MSFSVPELAPSMPCLGSFRRVDKLMYNAAFLRPLM